ncbi:hypothetical protein Bbelb_023020 [Branchiostoma belcheri]|nr:hypothetical protein Bbelb_023020 [Branchiostoma belcheri]
MSVYEQAEPVRLPHSGHSHGQTSGPPPKPRPIHLGGSRVGNGASDKQREDQESSSDTYEEAEAVRRYASSTSADRADPGGARGHRGLRNVIRSNRYRWCVAAGIAVLLTLVCVTLASVTFISKEDVSQLSTSIDALKRGQDLSTSTDALKRGQDLSTTADALKRDQDLSTTVAALKHDQDDLPTTVAALKRDQDDISTTVAALKHDQDIDKEQTFELRLAQLRRKTTAGPVAVWPLNAKYGASDATRNGNDGRATGTQLAPGPYGNTDGAFLFSGTSDSYIDIPNNGQLDVQYAYTILAHVYHTGQDGPIFDYIGQPWLSGGWAVHLWQTAAHGLFMRPVGRDGQFVAGVGAPGVLELNAWNYVGGTYDSNTGVASLWNNGKLVGQKRIEVPSVATEGAVRVAVRDGDGRYFAGRIACIQLYNYAMTTEEIVAARDLCGGRP